MTGSSEASEVQKRQAMSTPGGRMSRVDAKKQWDEWATQDSGVLRCEDGPRHAPLMLRVRTGIFIDDGNTFAMGKEFSTSNGPMKNPTAADVRAPIHISEPTRLR